jgi:putative addiction module killer protein
VEVKEYQDANGNSPFREWFESLDSRAALKINTILTRMKHGNNSNIKGVGGGVFERIVDDGPGYRIYFGKDGRDLVILLCGGSKRGQQRDIDRAKKLWKGYKLSKHR